MKARLKILVPIIFVGLSLFYYFLPLKVIDFSNIFLTIATFLFAILTGFFISRQGKRYSSIRNQITSFDGEMSSIFRSFGHLGKAIQEKVKIIIKNHYNIILKNQAWDYHFTHKSNTITSIHNLCEITLKNKQFTTLKNFSVQRILVSLQNLQKIRKNMVALHNERIPLFQFILVYFLAFILLVTVSIIPSEANILGSILKGAFSSSIIFVVVLLHEFDRLRFFGGTIGENSARDILNIFSGKR